MFLHLGGDTLVDKTDIVVILSLESAAGAQATKEFLTNAEHMVRIGEKGKEKSLIITTKHLYLSPISSYTLMKRSDSAEFPVTFE